MPNDGSAESPVPRPPVVSHDEWDLDALAELVQKDFSGEGDGGGQQQRERDREDERFHEQESIDRPRWSDHG